MMAKAKFKLFYSHPCEVKAGYEYAIYVGWVAIALNVAALQYTGGHSIMALPGKPYFPFPLNYPQ